MTLQPMPLMTKISQPFWDGLRREIIQLPRCASCSHWIFYPRAICPCCGCRELQWLKVSGKASLYTYTVADYPVSVDFPDPCRILAIAELEEGVRMATALVDVSIGDVHIGMDLSPLFTHTSELITLLYFTRVGAYK